MSLHIYVYIFVNGVLDGDVCITKFGIINEICKSDVINYEEFRRKSIVSPYLCLNILYLTLLSAGV